MASCIITPEIKNKDGKTVKSNLFKDLQANLGREDAKRIWAMSQLGMFDDFTNIQRDENGEPTYESLDKAMNLWELKKSAEDNGIVSIDALRNHLQKQNGDPVLYENPNTLMKNVDQFNIDNKDAVAKIIEDEETGMYHAEIEKMSPDGARVKQQTHFKLQLNNDLLKIMRGLGFDFKFMDDQKRAGLFNPIKAEENADNLKVVISISKGLTGEAAFPHEMAHMLIAGINDQNMLKNLHASFTDDVVKRVLGEDYEAYKQAYTGVDENGNEIDTDAYLREEAEGQALAEMIISGKGYVQNTSWLSRLWARLKSMLRLGNVSAVDEAYMRAKQALMPIFDAVTNTMDDYDANVGKLKTIIDKDLILKGKTLNALSRKIDTMKAAAEEGLKLLEKKAALTRNGEEDKKFQRKNILAAREYLVRKQDNAACITVLGEIARQMLNISTNIDNFNKEGDFHYTDVGKLSKVASYANEIDKFIDAYSSFLANVANLEDGMNVGEIQIAPEDREQLMTLAKETLAECNRLKLISNQLREKLIKNFIIMYMGNTQLTNPILKGKEGYKGAAADMIMKTAWMDINFLNRDLFSIGDCVNPLVSMVHAVVVKQQAGRDSKVNKIANQLTEIHQKLVKAGYKDDFVYQMKDGKPTGWFVAPVDYDKYYKDREAFIAKLKETYGDGETTYLAIERQIHRWDREHTAEFIADPTTGRKERMPSPKYYAVEDYQKGWSDIQKEYYAAMMTTKGMLDSLAPSPSTKLYKAPQVRKSIIDMMGESSAKERYSKMWELLKGEYTIVEDTTEFGETNAPVGFDNKPVKRVPIYFTNMLNDMSLLDTDCTESMICYAFMAVNYGEMMKIASSLELLNNWVKEDMQIQQVSGGNPLVEVYNSFGKEIKNFNISTANGSNIDKAIEKFVERTVFNIRTQKIENVKINDDKSLNVNAAIKGVKEYSSMTNLGLNLFSGTSNLIMGDAQMLTEAYGGRHFNMKDLRFSAVEYDRLLLDFMKQFNSVQRHDKLSMFISTFNSNESFESDLRDKNFSNSWFKRVLGKTSLLFMQNAGEHILHSRTMLAILHHIKVHTASGEHTLYDMLEVKHDERGYYVGIKEDFIINATESDKENAHHMLFNGMQTTVVEGQTIMKIDSSNMDQLFQNLNLYINNINASMHGGYSQAEKGNGNQKAWFQLLMQFRQWMPATYNKRYSKRYHDAVMEEDREGFYNTAWKFYTNMFKDGLGAITRYNMYKNKLSSWEKANLRQFYFEMAMFITLIALTKMLRGYKDKDTPWAKKFLAYNLYRLRLDIGSLVPTPDAIMNLVTQLKSPAAAIDGVAKFFNLFKFWNLADTVDSGVYEGWPVYCRDLLKALPFYNVKKAFDMATDNYMFNIFTKNITF